MSPPHGQPRTYNILVLEDSVAEHLILQESFNSCGHHCSLKFATTLEEAAFLLDADHFSLVIVDIELGWQDGLDFVHRLRADPNLSCIPVIALSGMKNEIRRAYSAGVNAFIEKAVDWTVYQAKMKTLMDFWVFTAELPEADTSMQNLDPWPVRSSRAQTAV